MPELTRDSIAQDGCPALFDVRVIESPQAAELYINVRPAATGDADDQVAAVYGQLAALLHEHSARILSERIFVGGDAAPSVGSARSDALGDLDDGVPPTVLVTPPSDALIHGIQVHAVRAGERPDPIADGDSLIGRRIMVEGRSWVHLAALTAPDAGSSPAQASEVYERAVRVLRSLDMHFNCVARTWVWLRDILSWYPQFNEARTAVFGNEGLVAVEAGARFLPASTGIGVAPADGGACGLELMAISDGGESIRSSHAAGEQCSAFAYGSAFARAVVAPTPAGRALLVSGTAAIDPQGIRFLDFMSGKERAAKLPSIIEAEWETA